jgi:hypothetical protein
VVYISRALTEVEQRYSQTEREALSITWCCERLHTYVYGAAFTVITDHKPLESIFNNARSNPPALRLQPYNCKLVYRPGKYNQADYMSRHPLQNTKTTSRESKVAEQFINFITENIEDSIPAITTELVKVETKQDHVLRELVSRIRDNK